MFDHKHDPGDDGETEPKADEEMEVDKDRQSPQPPKKEETDEQQQESLESLSDQLSLEHLWDALSSCLKDLADTPDHHAVLVLQATVEAFFLVHTAATQPEEKKKVQLKESRTEQLAHIQE